MIGGPGKPACEGATNYIHGIVNHRLGRNEGIMEYNEEEYKIKANRKARNVWFTLSLILTFSYGSDTAQNIRTGEYFIAFLLMCWIPFLAGLVVLR